MPFSSASATRYGTAFVVVELIQGVGDRGQHDAFEVVEEHVEVVVREGIRIGHARRYVTDEGANETSEPDIAAELRR